jgi:predicted Fe-Mo cluster-binding NifX family protein
MAGQEYSQTETKIAIVTNDGVTIASHFGMAEFYAVITAQAGKIISREQRSKPHYMMHPDVIESKLHDHQDMFAPIRDCQVLLCGGMRTPAYKSAEATGLHVIMTGGPIENAVMAYLSGNLVSESHRIRNV